MTGVEYAVAIKAAIDLANMLISMRANSPGTPEAEKAELAALSAALRETSAAVEAAIVKEV